MQTQGDASELASKASATRQDVGVLRMATSNNQFDLDRSTAGKRSSRSSKRGANAGVRVLNARVTADDRGVGKDEHPPGGASAGNNQHRGGHHPAASLAQKKYLKKD